MTTVIKYMKKAFLLFCLFFIASTANAQLAPYGISGQCLYWDIYDEKWQPMPNTTIQLFIATGTNIGAPTSYHNITTDANGNYTYAWSDTPNVRRIVGLQTTGLSQGFFCDPSTGIWESLSYDVQTDMLPGTYSGRVPNSYWWPTGN